MRRKYRTACEKSGAFKSACTRKMQGLSSRAHAFSVESLVGNTVKRMKVDNGKDASSPTDTEKETSPVWKETEEHDDRDGQRRRSRYSPRRSGVRVSQSGRVDGLRPQVSGSEPGRESVEVQVELQGSDLWTRFHEIGTEMIITKAGRRMFPSVRVKVSHMDPCQQYYIALDIMPVDCKRYRYVYHSSQWMVAGNTDHSCIAPRLYIHPDSPCAGETWMRQVISFDRVKLTNNEMDDKGHIILQSMHKYKPRVHVITHNPQFNQSQIPSLPAEGVVSFSFPETEFTTVTAYQNQQITKLKIDRNPFAKGFRDPGRNRGMLDGLLDSYPWRSPLNLQLKPFTLQLQGGNSKSPAGYTPVKNTIPLSCVPSSHPFVFSSSFSSPDARLHSFSWKASPSPQGLSPLPLLPLPIFSALQGRKALSIRAPCHHGGVPRPPPSLHPHHSGPSPSYCLYRYALPMDTQLAAKLAQGHTDCLIHQTTWQTPTNHYL
ncbi:hypothetical protein UPYG_G00219840 [Umbra pygmaea]|uniref:T-box domain-containing protein n=1 Tax=Umbra pygmaea TaxID=75934 RepID=A0ABD0X3K0_UMBPY